MSVTKWSVTFLIYRQKNNELPHYDQFKLEVNPDEYVLDGVERAWAFHDRTLMFRHACHHSTCGACGMRVNDVEKLTCITPIREVTHDGGTIKVDPLRNFPVEGDLVVDMGTLFKRMDEVGHQSVVSFDDEPAGRDIETDKFQPNEPEYLHLSDCIECGMCISACPIATTTATYLGPAVLAGAQQHGVERSTRLLELVDSEDGVWRCHSAYECTEVCPSFVEPGTRIMELRRQIVAERFRRLFRPARARALESEVSQ